MLLGLALSVGAHVTLSHADTDQTAVRDGRPWQVPVILTMLLTAALLRGLVDWVPRYFFLWLGGARAGHGPVVITKL